mmetsp:Transcript_7190/g.19683  ORF Transcript_7190/g.19683 Transcript_7190/m.19683 type:complete len:390 (-) Transcript_7190:90-1259(-)|eukprot:CAMPEP_0182611850 /NCGR_PEP_ID=MMETSP1330-20130603/15764_1 /TAXON_ID=464278 /ORGANISM="Picochlorum sp., Strain RCC944" /LENGTH=389 /DNA_ID=CAMNT_0024831303 /DNA_START=56 /DNA_END=1225 /DNA_ORIENTATION=+
MMNKAIVCLFLASTPVVWSQGDGNGTSPITPIVPTGSEFYSSCPACELSWQALPGAAGGEETISAALAIRDKFISSLSTDSVGLFCGDGISWGTSSEKLRTSAAERLAYFDFIQARNSDLSLEITPTCTQAILLPNGLVRVMFYNSIREGATDRCARIVHTIDTANSCVKINYGSAVPDDPEALRQVDFDNQMPWQNGSTVDLAGPAEKPNTAPGSCSACDTKYSNAAGLTQEQVDRAMNVAKAAWVSSLIDNDASSIADTYCENGNLWGTVTAMSRNTRDEIQSYFDWFANSRNFTEAIRSTCATVTKIGDGVLVVSLELNLEGQCLRMQFTLVEDEDGTQCVAALDSSYVPATSQQLLEFDARTSGSFGLSSGWLAVAVAVATLMMT